MSDLSFVGEVFLDHFKGLIEVTYQLYEKRFCLWIVERRSIAVK